MTSLSTQATVNLTSAAESSGFHMAREAVLAAAIVEILIVFVGMTGNLFTIIAVLRNSALQYATNYLIVSLAVADLLVSAILVPMRASQHIAYQTRYSIPKTFVVVAGFVGRVNIIASISTLVCLSVDRYVALSRPLRYLTSIRYNLKKVLVVIATVWSVAIFITSLPKFPGVTDTPFLIFFVVFVLVATLIISLMYYQIFKIVAKSLRLKASGQPVRYSNYFKKTPRARDNDGAKQTESSKSEKPNADASADNKTSSTTSPRETLRSYAAVATSSIAVPLPPTAPTSASDFSRERKAATTVGLVIVAFVLLVYPRIIMILYHFANEQTPESKVARFWMRVMLYANSAVNPIFYAYRHKGFRQEFKKMALWCLGPGAKLRRRNGDFRRSQYSQSSTATRMLEGFGTSV